MVLSLRGQCARRLGDTVAMALLAQTYASRGHRGGVAERADLSCFAHQTARYVLGAGLPRSPLTGFSGPAWKQVRLWHCTFLPFLFACLLLPRGSTGMAAAVASMTSSRLQAGACPHALKERRLLQVLHRQSFCHPYPAPCRLPNSPTPSVEAFAHLRGGLVWAASPSDDIADDITNGLTTISLDASAPVPGLLAAVASSDVAWDMCLQARSAAFAPDRQC